MNHIYINIYVDKVKFHIIYHKKDEKIEIKDGEIILPVSFDMGDRLFYIKKMINTLIQQYNIEIYNIQTDEVNNIELIEIVKIQGVLEELFSSKGVVLWK